MLKKYRVVEDPGHAWLEVPMAEIIELGIRGKISKCSYKKGDMAYLEEDCDLSVFVKARQAAGHPEIEYEEIYQDPTPIRGYSRFK